MRHLALLSASAALALAFQLPAQTPSASPQTPAPPAPPRNPAPAPSAAPPPGATVLKAGTQLVVVDVVVQDANGNPVHGLKSSNFHLTESKSPQPLHSFEEHTPAPSSAPGPEFPKLPPGTFTDYTPVPPTGALNILLLDALNTPMKDQSFVRNQLQQYVKNAPPGARIAIFGLANKLILLQGFTSSPDTLKDAVNHKLIPRASSLLDDPVGTNVDTESMSDSMADAGASAEAVANVAQFEAEQSAIQTQFRLQYTLDAFNSLAHYLANFPGRKNLLWFSGSFPIDILPDPSISNPFAVMEINDDQFRETTNLLAKAQVAVYPIDARGLMTQPMFDAANSGRAYARSPGAFGAAANKFSTSQAQEHMTMEQLATDTGGHAYYNTNGLAQAVAKAIDAGSSYYTLTYAPSNRNFDGNYREIRVNLVDTPPNLKLAYRHGYYADDPDHPKKNQIAATTPETTATPTPNSAQIHAEAYARSAMARGAPTPQDILFKVRVLPASTTTEETVAKDNALDPIAPVKGPFQRYDVDFAALPGAISLIPTPDGHFTGSIAFLANVYDVDGKLLNAASNTIKMHLDPDTRTKFLHSAIQFHLEVSAPAKRDTYLRIAIQDIPSNRFGVVEIPVSTVSRLTPPTYPPPPSQPAPTTTAPAPPAPASPAPH